MNATEQRPRPSCNLRIEPSYGRPDFKPHKYTKVRVNHCSRPGGNQYRVHRGGRP